MGKNFNAVAAFSLFRSHMFDQAVAVFLRQAGWPFAINVDDDIARRPACTRIERWIAPLPSVLQCGTSLDLLAAFLPMLVRPLRNQPADHLVRHVPASGLDLDSISGLPTRLQKTHLARRSSGDAPLG